MSCELACRCRSNMEPSRSVHPPRVQTCTTHCRRAGPACMAQQMGKGTLGCAALLHKDGMARLLAWPLAWRPATGCMVWIQTVSTFRPGRAQRADAHLSWAGPPAVQSKQTRCQAHLHPRTTCIGCPASPGRMTPAAMAAGGCPTSRWSVCTTCQRCLMCSKVGAPALVGVAPDGWVSCACRGLQAASWHPVPLVRVRHTRCPCLCRDGAPIGLSKVVS